MILENGIVESDGRRHKQNKKEKPEKNPRVSELLKHCGGQKDTEQRVASEHFAISVCD